MTRRIMWFAMVQGVVLFCGILIYKGMQSSNPPPANYELFKYIFLLVAMTTVLSLGKIKTLIENNPAPGPSPTPKRNETKTSTSFFILMAVCEASVLIGAILAYLSGNMNDLYLLAAPGAIGMILNFPREDQ